MKIKIFLVIIFSIKSIFSSAQSDTIKINDYNKVKHSVILSIGRSIFNVYNVPESPKYPTLELRMGFVISKPINESIEIKSGVCFGLKFKRESYFFGPNNQFTYEPYVLPGLDETASSRNHLAVEIPLLLQYNVYKRNFSLKSGIYTRFWKPDNSHTDDLSSRTEIGLLSGITHKFTRKLNFGLEYYHGLSNIYFRGLVTNNSIPKRFRVTNQFIQITCELAIERKRHK